MDLDIWACPECLSELSEHGSEIACVPEARVFRRMDGLPVLVRPEREPLLADAQRYASAWKKTKWAVPRETILELPYVRRPGWKQNAQSFRELLTILGPPRERRVVDVGAGTGWLSYRRTQEGFRCFATDISADSDVGLVVAKRFDNTPYRFERAIATLDRWPFRSRSIDIAICNASLHYLAGPRVAIAEAARVLRSEGVFVIMNTSVHRDPESANRACKNFRKRMRRLGACGGLVNGHQQFVASELESGLGDRFVKVRLHETRGASWFNMTRALKAAILGIELASFPI